MYHSKAIVSVVLALFVWQGIAEAASISTRVRVLENKVSKQNKQIKKSLSQQKLHDVKMDKSLAKVEALEKKIDLLLEGKKRANRKPERRDKRYAFP